MNPRVGVVFIGPNADAGNEMIRAEWQKIAATRQNAVYHENVEPKVFYSLMNWCDVMVGNSSAGLYEALCFGIPVVDIGDRQMGRVRPPNMINIIADAVKIADAIDFSVWDSRSKEVLGLYGDGHASERIAKVVSGIKDPKALLRKRFHEYRYLPEYKQ